MRIAHIFALGLLVGCVVAAPQPRGGRARRVAALGGAAVAGGVVGGVVGGAVGGVVGGVVGSAIAQPLPFPPLPVVTLPPPIVTLPPPSFVNPPPPVVNPPPAPGAEIKFGYQGNAGPKLWPDFCQDPAAGQSPIDIRAGSVDVNPGTLAVKLQPLSSVTMENKNGEGVKFTPAANAAPITFVPTGQANGAQEVFTMEEFHLHTPSEHTVNGVFFDAEMHMVFKSASGQIAVVAAFMEISAAATADPTLSLMERSLPLRGAAVQIPNLDLSSIAAAANQFTGFFTYTGSLTTPPCSPNVLWHVMQTPIQIPVSMALALRKEQGFNARFSQVARDEVPTFNAGLVAAAA